MDTDDQLIKEIQGLRAELAQLPGAIVNAIKGVAPAPVSGTVIGVGGPGGAGTGDPKPLPVPVPAPVIVPVPAPTPILEKPGVGMGALGLIASLVMSVLGVTGPVTGEGATTTGQLLPLLSGGLATLGATGMLGSWGSALSSVLSLLTKGPQQPSQQK